MAYEYSRCWGSLWLGAGASGTAGNTVAIDSAFVFETSGDAFFAQFVAPVSQSAATLTFYAYAISVTGTPDFQIEVRKGYQNSGNVDAPEAGGSNLASSPSTLSLSSADNTTWVSATCTVSLTAGETYFVILKNTHATPATNHSTFRYRSPLGTFASTGYDLWNEACLAGYTNDGFATDPTVTTSGPGTFVVKFGDGSLLGFPYVDSASHANDANDRGMRFSPAEDIVVSGWGWAASFGGMQNMTIYHSDGTLIVNVDVTALFSTVANHSFTRFAPVTLSGGNSYDVVRRSTGATTSPTIYNMGETEGNVPADVLACRPPLAYVDGTTPGSYTVDTSKIVRMRLLVDNMPAISGGGIGWGNKRGNKQ